MSLRDKGEQLGVDLARIGQHGEMRHRRRQAGGCRRCAQAFDARAAGRHAEREAEAVVHLGRLTDGDVRVELVHGPVGQSDELTGTSTVPMTKDGSADGDGALRYRGRFACESPGRYGLTVRVVPSHPDLATATELGVVSWA